MRERTPSNIHAQACREGWEIQGKSPLLDRAPRGFVSVKRSTKVVRKSGRGKKKDAEN